MVWRSTLHILWSGVSKDRYPRCGEQPKVFGSSREQTPTGLGTYSMAQRSFDKLAPVRDAPMVTRRLRHDVGLAGPEDDVERSLGINEEGLLTLSMSRGSKTQACRLSCAMDQFRVAQVSGPKAQDWGGLWHWTTLEPWSRKSARVRKNGQMCARVSSQPARPTR